MRKINVTVGVILTALTVSLLPELKAAQDEQAATPANRVVGTWLADITPAGGFPPPFRMLVTYTSDGTLIATQNDAMVPPFFLSPAHGAWASKHGAISATVLQFASDPAGNYVGILTATYSIRMDSRNSQIISVAVRLVAPDGTEVFSGSGAGTATRVVADAVE